MNFYDLFEVCQIRAIHAAIEPNLVSIFRIKCREYSERFHTPLHVVENELDPMFVLQHLYEAQYTPGIVDEELEELMDKLYTIKDPEYSRMSKEDMEELVDAVMNKEIERLSKKKAPTQETIKAEEIKAAYRPKSGSMNFDQLEKIDSNAESNKSGFDPQ